MQCQLEMLAGPTSIISRYFAGFLCENKPPDRQKYREILVFNNEWTASTPTLLGRAQRKGCLIYNKIK